MVGIIPRWKSHKVVQADKINAVMGEDNVVQGFLLDCGQIVEVDANFCARGTPALGDYFVVYQDGYASWSPAAAFEEGYSRIHEPSAEENVT